MTGTLDNVLDVDVDVEPMPVERRRRHAAKASFWRPATWSRRQWLLALVVLTAVAFAVRLFRQQESYDLFVDEPFYAQVGLSVARGNLPYAAGVHFFLHPPGFFLVEALWMRIFGEHDDVFAQVYSIRKLISVFAALTVLLVAVIVSKALNRTTGLIAALAYLLNTFVNRDSAIAILEPSTIFFTAAGFAVLLSLSGHGRRRTWQLVAAGLLFGFSVMCKEFAVFTTIVPMVVALFLRTPLRRSEALLVAALSTVPYLIWVAVVVVTGNWSTFVFQISTGFSRTAGATQITGFNRPGAPSFLDTLLANIETLWTAYLVLGLGSLAVVWMAWKHRDPRHKLLACWGLGAIPLLAYCVTLGTNEEQFFMFLMPPALICLVIVVVTSWRSIGRGLRVAVATVCAAVVVSDVVNYAVIHTVPDNGSYLLDAWMAEHVPLGTTVAVTNSVQREMFIRYTMVNATPGATLSPDVRYLVVAYKLVDHNYAFIDRASVDQQTRTMRVAYETTDRSNGRMVVYAVD